MNMHTKQQRNKRFMIISVINGIKKKEENSHHTFIEVRSILAIWAVFAAEVAVVMTEVVDGKGISACLDPEGHYKS